MMVNIDEGTDGLAGGDSRAGPTEFSHVEDEADVIVSVGDRVQNLVDQGEEPVKFRHQVLEVDNDFFTGIAQELSYPQR